MLHSLYKGAVLIFLGKKNLLHKACIGGCWFENKLQRPCWNLFADSIFKSWLCCISSMVSSNFLGGCPNHVWKSAQNMRKSAKQMNIWMISMRCDWVDMGQPLMGSMGVFFGEFWSEVAKTLKNTKKTHKKSRGVHEWLGHRVSFFVFLFLVVCFLDFVFGFLFVINIG